MSTTANWAQPKTFTLSIDGTVLTSQTFPTASSLWHTWNTAGVGDGPHTLTLTVTSNGQSASSTLAVTVANAAAAAGAQPPPAPAAELMVNATQFKTGDPMVVSRALSNGGSQALVDVYFGIGLPAEMGAAVGCPQGDAIVFVADGGAMGIHCASDAPSEFPRLSANAVIPAALPRSIAEFFGLVWPQAPPGVYRLFMALTKPGSLAGGSSDPANVLALSLTNLSFSE
jgi:hypothetical protein